MASSRKAGILAVLVALLSVYLRAAIISPQGQGPAKVLVSIKIKGTKRYTEDAVIAASGLQLGKPATEDDFKKAARTLGDNGAFTDIAYSFSFSSAGTKLELQVTDAPKFLPARFEDFVWFSDADLDKAIRSHVPLFNGEIPAFGRMADEVSNALQTLLVQDGIAGRVDYLRAAGPNGDIASFNYFVSDVLIRVRKVEFTGIGPDELAPLENAAEKLSNTEYSRTRIETLITRQLLPILHAHGYLRASFAPPAPKVVKLPAQNEADSSEDTKNRTIIDVDLDVKPGLQYKLSKIEWIGNHAVPTDQLQSLLTAKIGDPANTTKLSEQLGAVRTLYGSRGYVNVTISVEATYEDATAAVSLKLEVNEDAVYHMGELEFRGLDNSLTAKLREAWKIREGDVYDATYIKEYLPLANKLLPSNFDWEVTPHVTANVKDKSVDVDLQYAVKAPK